MYLRRLLRHDIPLIWTIDRSEEHHAIYQLHDNRLVRVPAYFYGHGWPPDQIEHDTPLLEACFDRGGAFLGMFADTQLVGVAVVDTLPLGEAGSQRQLKYLYVSHGYRGQGIGRRLFAEAQAVVRAQGAEALYISATPTENTINFYMRCGAVLNPSPDPELFALEPDDIHLICPV